MDLAEVLLTGLGCSPRVLGGSSPLARFRAPPHPAGWQVSIDRALFDVVAGQHIETLSGGAEGAGTQRDLDVQLDEGGAPLGPARKTASGPTAAPQQLLAEIRGLTQHQGMVEATPQGDGALQIVNLRTDRQHGQGG